MNNFNQTLHVVTGKGGVGKSVMACAIADGFARQGLRTLLCQINAPDSHARLLDIDTPSAQIQLAKPCLYTVNIDPEQALLEYAKMILKFDAVVRSIFENRLIRTFLRFLPSLSELNVLGKIWFHAEETVDGRKRFDRVVVDAPSTGHAERLFSVAQVMFELSRGVGPLAEKAAEMKTTLEDPDKSVLHVVTLPEEMPVNETIELVRRMEKLGSLPLGTIFLNQMTSLLFEGGIAETAPQKPGSLASAVFGAAHRRAQTETLEREQAARLRKELLGYPITPIAKVSRFPFRSEAIRDVCASIEQNGGADVR